MQLSSAIRPALIALTVTGAGLTTVYADFGSIRFNVIKAGFVVGGSGGSGTLVFHGRPYPISIGGVSYGFTFGASATDFVGEVSNIRTPFDVNGVYGAAGAGIAVGPGAGGIVLVNQNGAVLTLSGRQMGLIVAARPQWAGDFAAVVCARPNALASVYSAWVIFDLRAFAEACPPCFRSLATGIAPGADAEVKV